MEQLIKRAKAGDGAIKGDSRRKAQGGVFGQGEVVQAAWSGGKTVFSEQMNTLRQKGGVRSLTADLKGSV